MERFFSGKQLNLPSEAPPTLSIFLLPPLNGPRPPARPAAVARARYSKYGGQVVGLFKLGRKKTYNKCFFHPNEKHSAETDRECIVMQMRLWERMNLGAASHGERVLGLRYVPIRVPSPAGPLSPAPPPKQTPPASCSVYKGVAPRPCLEVRSSC